MNTTFTEDTKFLFKILNELFIVLLPFSGDEKTINLLKQKGDGDNLISPKLELKKPPSGLQWIKFSNISSVEKIVHYFSLSLNYMYN